MEDPLPLNDRLMIMLIDGAFHASKVAAKVVTLSIRQQFGRPWPTWGAIPKDHHDLFFQRFKEEFEARLSQARFYVVPSVGESQLTSLDPFEEQRLKSQYWVAATGPKCKGHLYGTRDIAHTYKYGNDNFMQNVQGSFSRAEDAAEINRLRSRVNQRRRCMFFNPLSFSSYLLKRGTLFINNNNLTSNIINNRTINPSTNMTNSRTRQMINSRIRFEIVFIGAVVDELLTRASMWQNGNYGDTNDDCYHNHGHIFFAHGLWNIASAHRGGGDAKESFHKTNERCKLGLVGTMDKFLEEDDNENDKDWVLGRQKQATMSANAMVALELDEIVVDDIWYDFAMEDGNNMDVCLEEDDDMDRSAAVYDNNMEEFVVKDDDDSTREIRRDQDGGLSSIFSSLKGLTSSWLLSSRLLVL
ncbi:hypothetical protein JHK85_023212 [Glycine max]|nr:hypothetical protein JHK85_023212 [Glycine max]